MNPINRDTIYWPSSALYENYNWIDSRVQKPAFYQPVLIYDWVNNETNIATFMSDDNDEYFECHVSRFTIKIPYSRVSKWTPLPSTTTYE